MTNANVSAQGAAALAARLGTPARPWSGAPDTIATDVDGLRARLLALSEPVYAVGIRGAVGITNQGAIQSAQVKSDYACLGSAAPVSLEQFGDPAFCAWYGTRYAYYAGAMANAIASEEMVIQLGKAGFLGSYGAAGNPPARLEAALQRIQAALPNGPYAINLIHAPNEQALEVRAVELFQRYNITTVEASAFIDLSPSIIYYRVSGLSQAPNGQIQIKNRVIAKLSRKEVAARFLAPPPAAVVSQLLAEGRITPEQANLAQYIPMADDITVEADSGGHTDNRALVCLLPTMLALRDEYQERHHYVRPVRIGAAGGISTPGAALGAFMMGAAFIGTGSVNQACVEAGASEHTRSLLAQLDMADVTMAPSADMFEMGVKVQVVKKGTLFAMRALKLYDLYSRYNAWEDVPQEERDRIEKQVFKREFSAIWQDTVKFFTERDPDQIARAKDNPKRQMALVFRWYLGLSSRWSNAGEKGREMDYQIWCGPAIGPFNDWTRGTYLADFRSRKVVDVALQILTGCAYLYRLQTLKMQGLLIPSVLEQYRPDQPLFA
jgi:PfaD family protein